MNLKCVILCALDKIRFSMVERVEDQERMEGQLGLDSTSFKMVSSSENREMGTVIGKKVKSGSIFSMGEISAFCMLSKKTQLKETTSVARTEGEIIGAQMEYVISRITCQRCPHSSPWNQLNILYYMVKGTLKIQ